MADAAAGSGLKTIADFRRDNGPAIRAACRQFIALCRKLELFTHAVAAIDGSKFKAVNTRDKNFTKAKLKARMAQVEASIERYLAALETADRHDGEIAEIKAVRLKEKIAALREQMEDFQALEVQVRVAPDQQIPGRKPTTASGTALSLSARSSACQYGQGRPPDGRAPCANQTCFASQGSRGIRPSDRSERSTEA